MANVNIHAFSDTIMQGLMERLGISIPSWIVRRRVRVTRERTSDKNHHEIFIEGRDPDQTEIPFSLFKSIQVQTGEGNAKELTKEPFAFRISTKNTDSILIRLHFFGHYNEVPFDLNYSNVTEILEMEEFYLFYNPLKGQWRKTKQADDLPL